ncbi:hypothetical protein ABUE31_22280 [Mesorhizobium sp. ZMM04-5]|uniref:Uncharacterized protein n=1 Tax=Mesorhizobium marinum TaxID=3228790 RepID=A0ABV3R5Z0_9HYPH
MQTWTDAAELANAIEERVLCGARRIALSPATALMLVETVRSAIAHPQQAPPATSKFNVDLYGTGSCIMEVDQNADIRKVVAWAENTLAARAAFDELCRRNPTTSYHQRRRSWVEADRMVKR